MADDVDETRGDSAALLTALGNLQLLLAFQVSPLLAVKHGVDVALYHMLKRIIAGAVFPSQLARAGFEPPSKISRRLDKLEALGLIRRVLDKDDTRRVRIELNPGAIDAVALMDAEFNALLEPALDTLPASARATLLSSLEQLYTALLPAHCEAPQPKV